MDPVILIARWLHILAATVSVGVPIFILLALLPAVEQLDDESRKKVREASAARWRIVVYVSIVIFLATGLYNFLVVKRWAGLEAKTLYHALFGIKFLLALGLFFLLSALAGRSAVFEGIRKNTRMWTGVSVLLGLAIIGISGVLRFLQ